MYHTIKHNEHMNLLSNTKQTAAGKKLWAELAKTFTVKVIELSSGKIISNSAASAYIDDTATTALVTETLINSDPLLIPSMKIANDSIL